MGKNSLKKCPRACPRGQFWGPLFGIFCTIMSVVMDDDSEEVMDFLDDDDEQDNGERMPRRYIRDMESPFDRYDEEAFLRRYRFSKGTVLQSLIPLISGEKVTKRGLPVPPVYRICILLRFLATCSFQVSFHTKKYSIEH